MSSRDLLQRRETERGTGNSIWTDSPLVRAARRGHLCILDGIDRLPMDATCVLLPLIQDRFLELANERLAASDGSILPRFAIIAVATAEIRGGGGGGGGMDTRTWLGDDLLAAFTFQVLAPPTLREVAMMSTALGHRLQATDDGRANGNSSSVFASSGGGLLEAAQRCGLTLQQILRVGRCMSAGMDGAQVVRRLAGVGIMPPAERGRYDEILRPHVRAAAASEGEGVGPEQVRRLGGATRRRAPLHIHPTPGGGAVLMVGARKVPLRDPARPELVPRVDFVPIPEHNALLHDIAEDIYLAGERFLLLLGPQGVGKNRVVDYFLQSTRVEREYMQLHRDTTPGSLTITPIVERGNMLWVDSPLVRAAKCGRTVVIDEADKAPLEVIVVLKSLANDGFVKIMYLYGFTGSRVMKHLSTDTLDERTHTHTHTQINRLLPQVSVPS